VIGLGRFGSALADTLIDMGHEVMGLDANADIVQEASLRLDHAAQINATNINALEQIGAKHFPIAVVGIGDDVEASILTTAALADLGIRSIWAKAITQSHGRILERVGAHHVVFPEHDMGQRVAHLLTGRMMDYMELDESFAIVETTAPAEMVGKSLRDTQIRKRHEVTVVCVKPAGETFTYATPETVINADDVLLIAGETPRVTKFAELS